MKPTLRLLIAIILALVLTILPLPELFIGLRPPWILLLTLYVQYYLPEYFNVRILIIIGLMLDVLLATVIGEHSFALILVSWFANNKARRFTLFSMGQQMGLVGFFCWLYQFIIAIIDAFLGFHPSFILTLGNALVSALFWPWLKLIGISLLSLREKMLEGRMRSN